MSIICQVVFFCCCRCRCSYHTVCIVQRNFTHLIRCQTKKVNKEILNQHKSYRTLLSAILNTGLYLHIILYIWIFPRYLLFYSIYDKMPIDKHIYNNNQLLNVQNTCCKSTILLPDSISAILNLWTIADHLIYFNKNLLFSIYFVGNYKKCIKKNNQYHRNTSFNIHIN
jgi:hypothetical protein